MEDIPGQLSSVGVPAEEHSIDPVSQALPWQLEGGGGFSHCQEGYMPGLMRLKDHIKSLSASLPAGGSTDLAA